MEYLRFLIPYQMRALKHRELPPTARGKMVKSAPVGFSTCPRPPPCRPHALALLKIPTGWKKEKPRLGMDVAFCLSQSAHAMAEDSEAWSSLLRSRFDACRVDAAVSERPGGRAALADLELKVVEEQVALARQQRNKVLGPCRLPPEILSHIFLLAKDGIFPQFGWIPKCVSVSDSNSSREGGQAKLNIKYSLGWLVLSHVCRTWRQVSGDTLAGFVTETVVGLIRI